MKNSWMNDIIDGMKGQRQLFCESMEAESKAKDLGFDCVNDIVMYVDDVLSRIHRDIDSDRMNTSEITEVVTSLLENGIDDIDTLVETVYKELRKPHTTADDDVEQLEESEDFTNFVAMMRKSADILKGKMDTDFVITSEQILTIINNFVFALQSLGHPANAQRNLEGILKIIKQVSEHLAKNYDREKSEEIHKYEKILKDVYDQKDKLGRSTGD